jgi:hypothetical protein
MEVEMQVDHFEHARAALLACGGAVEVVKPDALRLPIADFAQRIVETYSQPPGDCLCAVSRDGSQPDPAAAAWPERPA